MSPNELCDKKMATAKITRAGTASVSFFSTENKDSFCQGHVNLLGTNHGDLKPRVYFGSPIPVNCSVSSLHLSSSLR